MLLFVVLLCSIAYLYKFYMWNNEFVSLARQFFTSRMSPVARDPPSLPTEETIGEGLYEM